MPLSSTFFYFTEFFALFFYFKGNINGPSILYLYFHLYHCIKKSYLRSSGLPCFLLMVTFLSCPVQQCTVPDDCAGLLSAHRGDSRLVRGLGHDSHPSQHQPGKTLATLENLQPKLLEREREKFSFARRNSQPIVHIISRFGGSRRCNIQTGCRHQMFSFCKLARQNDI